MNRPKAVVFDLGKVLLDFDYGRAARRLAAHSSATEEEIREALDQSPLLHEYETGLLSTPDFFAEAVSRIGFKGDQSAFASHFADIFTPIDDMIALHGELRLAGIPTFVFSNTNELAIAHIRRSYAFYRDFTGHVLSYEETAMKPTSKIYQAVEKVTWLKGADLLYIDDRLENIEEGQRRGWQTVLHENPEETINVVRKAVSA
jgi:putative hydrolase of the HAD superfamily